MARYLSTNSLIESVKRRASLPQTQATFKEEDFLAFANEEMDLGVVPLILQFHEDYLMVPQEVPLVQTETRYEIPNRAIGNKVRDIFYKDSSGTSYELTRISVEDIPFFQYGSLGAITSPLRSFYVEGSEICLMPNTDYVGPTGVLRFHYYMRPNEIVSEDRVARVVSFDYKRGLLTVDNVPDNFVNQTIFDITSSKSPYKLLAIDSVPTTVGTSLSPIFTFGTAKVMTLTLPVKSALVTGDYLSIEDVTTSTSAKYAFWFDLTGTDSAPSVASHTMIRIDVSAAVTGSDVASLLVPQINSTLNPQIKSVQSGANITVEGGGQGVSVGDNFTVYATFTTLTTTSAGTNTLPKKLNINDIVALSEETIIPQVPVELHAMLAQRIAMRCLEALGDTQGLQAAAAKLQEMEIKTGSVIDDRIEGAPLKVANRHSFLNTTKRYIRR